jgi:hypothetical protein
MNILRKIWPNILGVIFLLACGGGTVLFAQHSVTLTWTAPTSMPSGSYINIYRGTAAGAETSTPINPSDIAATTTTYTDSNVLANTKYYYIAKQCDVDISTNQPVCSAPSNEASATVPMLSTDLAAPAVLGAVGK